MKKFIKVIGVITIVLTVMIPLSGQARAAYQWNGSWKSAQIQNWIDQYRDQINESEPSEEPEEEIESDSPSTELTMAEKYNAPVTKKLSRHKGQYDILSTINAVHSAKLSFRYYGYGDGAIDYITCYVSDDKDDWSNPVIEKQYIPDTVYDVGLNLGGTLDDYTEYYGKITVTYVDGSVAESNVVTSAPCRTRE